jgi:NADH dehydrogenase
MSGLLAWMSWLFIHIFFLIGFRNRILVMIQWAWSYFTYDRSARLITGADRPVEVPAMEIAEEAAEIASRPDEPSILTSGK